MQIKVNNKLILICLLLCSLFLTSYIYVLDTYGISSDVNGSDIFSTNGGIERSSMSGGINAGHDDFMAAPNTSTKSSISSMRQSRWLSTKINFNILTAIAAVQMAFLIYYSRLSDQTYTRLISSIITIFLHKKDGMK